MSRHVPDDVNRREYYNDEKKRELELWATRFERKRRKRTYKSKEELYWIDLVEKVKIRIDELKNEMGDSEFKPTLRQLWYNMVSDGVIENTSNKYTYFNRHLTAA